MDLITCPTCGEQYSASYPRCPFCEEEGEDSRKIRYAPRHRVADRKKAQSARGGLIAVLVLVLALLGWYLFGDSIASRKDRDKTKDETPANQDQPALPVNNISTGDDPFYDPDGGTGTDQPGTDDPGADEPTQPAPPPVDENVDVSNAKLNRDDFTLGYAGEKFTVRLSGTEATPTWSIDNPNVATITAEGTVTAVANGDTKVHCKVGSRDLTCVVRVRNTGKTAAPSDAPMVATPLTPTAPSVPSSNTAPTTPSTTPDTPSTPTTTPSTTAHVDASDLSVKTNYGTTLKKDPGSGYPDCTVRIGGDPIALRIVGTDVAVSGWTSDNESIVKVSSDGKLTPVSAGTAHVAATVGDATVTCIIRVR